MLRGTFAMIDLRAIQANVHAVRGLLAASAKLLVTVKANGYGHGAADAARGALAGGADYLGVASPEEALALREAGITAPILCLGAVTPAAAAALAKVNVDITLGEPWVVDEVPQFNHTVSVHLKLDSGMTRLGARTEADALALWRSIQSRSDMKVVGVYTHLAASDAPELGHAERQMERFEALLQRLYADGLPQDIIIHAANSGAILRRKDWHFGMVRLGISAYGYPASQDFESPIALSPAMHFYAAVTRVTDVPAGTTVSYGATWTASRPSRIATLAAGYADGYHRALSNRGEVLLNGKLVPIVGRVCMDQMMVDVTDCEGVREGQVATLFGRSAPPEWNWYDIGSMPANEQLAYLIATFRAYEQHEPSAPLLSADSVASCADTISYELLCAVAGRVPRVVVEA